MTSPSILDAPTSNASKPLRKAVQQHILGSTLLITCFLIGIYNLEPSSWEDGWGDTIVSMLFISTPLGLLFLGHRLIYQNTHKKVVAYIFLIPTMILVMVFSTNTIENLFLSMTTLSRGSLKNGNPILTSFVLGLLNSALYNILMLAAFFLYATIERYFLKH